MAWETILKIKEEIKKHSTDKKHLVIYSSLSSTKSSLKAKKDTYAIDILFSAENQNQYKADMVISCAFPFSTKIKFNRPISVQDRRLFELYVPYAVLPYFARKLKKTFVITHFAQTLDGRIASVTGDSKWIGNQQNLVHAHRMRALIDGIVIGAKTLNTDNPRLTVRHVAGANPCKILIGGDDLDIKDFHIGQEDIILFSQNHQNLNRKGLKYRIKKKKKYYSTRDILEALFDLGIYSVYIEGGSITASAFLYQQTVDQVQIHFAPIILGSGITGFNFEGVKFLDEAIHFKSYSYQPIGDQIMFIGELC